MPEILQPFLSGLDVVCRAPTQLWSAPDGQIGAGLRPGERNRGVQGVMHSDVRVLDRAVLRARQASLEPAGSFSRPDGALISTALLRGPGLGDGTADPVVRVLRTRTVRPGFVTEEIELSSATEDTVEVTLDLVLGADFAPMEDVKSGRGRDPLRARTLEEGDGFGWSDGTVTAAVRAPGTVLDLSDTTAPRLSWELSARRGEPSRVNWTLAAEDSRQVVEGASTPAPWASAQWALRPGDPVPEGAAVVALQGRSPDPRVARLLEASLRDLSGLRMQLPARPECTFLAAGAPWFLTLFGRDSLWAARFMLPVDAGLAVGTLRTLARFQGTVDDPQTQEEPGKIMHELRRGSLSLHGEDVTLPPLYYGTVDATPLWVCLLHEVWKTGNAPEAVTELLPHAAEAVRWVARNCTGGFLKYQDTTGHGLPNQGWKDSADSVQFRDGRRARAPIALSEVQAYAFEALVKGAELLESFDGAGLVPAAEVRQWRSAASALAARFRAEFWLDDGLGPYVAIALDADGTPVDSVTSNMGHLPGTGLLTSEEEALIARRLVHASLNSGFGLRTLSTDSRGYWPLKYHGGSVWTHDTAIAIRGLLLAGHPKEARALANGLLRAAESFGYRMPELHSGVSSDESGHALPYPSACRPQAWSAAAAVVVAQALAG